MRLLTRPVWLLACGLLILSGCYSLRFTKGGGKASPKGERRIDAADIALPAGYRIEAVATGLTFPSGITFDDTGGIFVVEAGYASGEEWSEPRLLKVERRNVFTTIAAGDSNGPWNGVEYREGAFYVAEGGQLRGGRILKITRGGHITPLIQDLPSFGDHHTNGPVFGPDGYLYFGQGSATNSGVVGPDNYRYGWLKRHPEFHDIPCKDVVLSGQNYLSEDPRSKSKDTVETGAYKPYGEPSLPGEAVAGAVPCNGALMRLSLAGGKPELVAWGLRNPFAMAFSPAGGLYVIDNGYDQRGSRPVWGAGELLWKIEDGRWYGWPDYSGAKSLATQEFQPPRSDLPSLLLEHPPASSPAAAMASAYGDPAALDAVPAPTAVLPVHSSANGLDFARGEDFGFAGQAFVALFGDLAPSVGKVLEPVGFRVVRVNVDKGIIEAFAINRKSPHGPASLSGHGGLERPVALRFSPDGKSLYVVDFGVMTVSGKGVRPHKQTGVLWRIWKESNP